MSAFRVELRDELLGILREPTALFFSVLMPIGFFALFVSLFGGESDGGVPAGTSMLATFGAFGVISVVMMNPGIGVAEDRESGWLRAKQVTAVPIGVTLAAKVVAALPYAVGVLLAMAATAGALGVLEAPPLALARLAAVLLLGALPFALLGLAVGFQAGASASVAILNGLLFPSAILSGLWMPLEILPDWVGRIAPALPTRHLAQLALAQVGIGRATATSVLALLATTLVAAVLAGLSYRRARR